MSAKTEQRLLEGLKAFAQAAAAADAPGHGSRHRRPPRTARSSSAPGVESVVPAGSFRRRRETVADIDLLVETDDPAAAIDKLQQSPWSRRRRPVAIGGRPSRRPSRTTVQLLRGPQVDVMTMPPGRAGTYLVHFTGSAEHNVRLRAIARDQGWSLSEHGFARLDDNGESRPAETPSPNLRHRGRGLRRSSACRSSSPSCARTAARSRPRAPGKLPDARRRADDLHGDCHTHSDWSDGHETIERMAELARQPRAALPGADRPHARACPSPTA